MGMVSIIISITKAKPLSGQNTSWLLSLANLEGEEEIWFEEFAILNKATAISEVLLKVHQPCTRFYFTLF